MRQESTANDIARLYSEQDALGLAQCVRRGDITPGELVEECIRRIEALNPKLNAVVHKLYEYGRQVAASELPDGPFRGVPFLLKDLMMEWRGLPVTNGCRYFKDYTASTDWEIATRMKRSGLIVVGKTNVPEGGLCGSTEQALFGVTHNPWNEKATAGGSSGGAAVAVASGMLPMADASDGGGSIRVPASINGVVGLRPSRGRTTFGPDLADCWYGAAVNLCVSLTVRDSAAFLDVIGGQLPGEPYALPAPPEPFLSQVGKSPDRLRIGFVSGQPDGIALTPDAAAAVEIAARQCEQLGHQVEEITVHHEFPVEAFFRGVSVLSVAGTVPFSFSGQPAISLPLYWTREGPPLGTQFVGRIGGEATLLRLAGQIEEALPWRARRPPVSL